MDRTRARQIASGVAFLAVCAIAVLIVVSQTGGGSGGDTNLEDVGLVEQQLHGIPQHGTVLGDPKAKVRVIEYGDLQCPVCKGFSESVAIETIRSDERIMLAYAWDGVPLPAEHGFPLRIYIPDLYGMKQPKWIVAIDAVDRWEPGYWVARGWDREGRVAITSVVDVVAAGPMAEVGGIAHAGSRGVSKVEVRVDDSEWQPAQLRDPLSATAWVIWRARIAVTPGDHVFAVRAFDGEGRPQTAGFHTRRSRV